MEAHRQEDPMFSQRTKKAWSSRGSGPLAETGEISVFPRLAGNGMY